MIFRLVFFNDTDTTQTYTYVHTFSLRAALPISTPRSMTLMAGPIDTRINPTKVNELATSHSIEWFEQNLITRVPHRYPGAGREVYPGFLQVSAFLGMNRSEEHTSELQSLMRSAYAVFCLKKKKKRQSQET